MVFPEAGERCETRSVRLMIRPILGSGAARLQRFQQEP
jgi:hypothetical protein